MPTPQVYYGRIDLFCLQPLESQGARVIGNNVRSCYFVDFVCLPVFIVLV